MTKREKILFLLSEGISVENVALMVGVAVRFVEFIKREGK